MAVKKKRKKVLDHDPLAWLASDESADVDQTTVELRDNQQSGIDDSVLGGNTGYGFFRDETELGGNPGIGKSDESDQAGYGFFDEIGEVPSASTMYHDHTSHVIYLGSELTIHNVSACKQLIDKNLHAGVDIKLAAGDLHKIDTAGLQLLYSLKLTLQKTAQSIHWQDGSSVIDEVADQLGLSKLVGNSQNDAAFGFFDDPSSAADTDKQLQDAGFGFF